MDILLSDPAILFFAFAGLITTAVSIVRDTRSQRARLDIRRLPAIIDRGDARADRRELAA
jgi:hypothetical protein